MSVEQICFIVSAIHRIISRDYVSRQYKSIRIVNSDNKTVSKYLLVKAKGGMGNRMLCAVTGILYGQLTGRETVIDWRDETYSNDGSNAFPKFFSSPSFRPETVLPQDGTVRPDIWTGKLDKSMSNLIQAYDPDKHSSIRIHRKYSVDVSKLDYKEDILVFWNYKHRVPALHKYLNNSDLGFADLNTEQIIRKIVQEQMSLKGDIQQRICDYKAKNWHQTVIGLHIRHTDLRTNLFKYEGPLRRFLECVPDAYIFLSTDNRQVSEDYHKRYKNVFSTPKWFPDEMTSMHQNRSCPDKLENGIDALVDMYLLSACDYLIYPGSSTFSWISRLLSDIPSQNIVDIERFNPRVRLKKSIREFLQ